MIYAGASPCHNPSIKKPLTLHVPDLSWLAGTTCSGIHTGGSYSGKGIFEHLPMDTG